VKNIVCMRSRLQKILCQLQLRKNNHNALVLLHCRLGVNKVTIRVKLLILLCGVYKMTLEMTCGQCLHQRAEMDRRPFG